MWRGFFWIPFLDGYVSLLDLIYMIYRFRGNYVVYKKSKFVSSIGQSSKY